MDIYYISDLHLDFHIKRVHPKKIDLFLRSILPSLDFFGEVLIIAGDISHYNDLSIAFLKSLRRYFAKILLTYGNHDLYLVSARQKRRYQNSWKRLEEFQELCAQEDIVFLDNESFEYRGVCFYGGMGWYRVQDMKRWRELSNDAKLIVPTFDPNRFFEENYQKLLALSKVDVLFSHVPMIDLRKEESLYDPFYYWLGEYSARAFEHMQKIGTKCYIFGHTHQNFVLQKGFAIATNGVGYKYCGQKIQKITLTS